MIESEEIREIARCPEKFGEIPGAKKFPAVTRVIIAIAGGSVLLAGLMMIFLPGPAFLVIPLGLGILATEFRWARNILGKVCRYFRSMRNRRRIARDTPEKRHHPNISEERTNGAN